MACVHHFLCGNTNGSNWTGVEQSDSDGKLPIRANDSDAKDTGEECKKVEDVALTGAVRVGKIVTNDEE